MSTNWKLLPLAVALSLLACGGGGGGDAKSTPAQADGGTCTNAFTVATSSGHVVVEACARYSGSAWDPESVKGDCERMGGQYAAACGSSFDTARTCRHQTGTETEVGYTVASGSFDFPTVCAAFEGEGLPTSCSRVSCSGHGTCSAANGIAFCSCERGYVTDGLGCNPVATDPCAGQTCSGHGTCENVQGAAECVCASGYAASGLSCNPVATNPCAGQACSGHGTCAVVNGTATCSCESGYATSGLACTRTTAGGCTFYGTTTAVALCVNMVGSSWAPDTTQSSCQQTGGIYTATGCSGTNVVGRCRTDGGTSIEEVAYYYGMTSAQAKSLCEYDGGQFQYGGD